jgi:hypothetical protein
MKSSDLLPTVELDVTTGIKQAVAQVDASLEQVAIELNKLLAKPKRTRKRRIKKSAPVITEAPAEVSASVN